MVVNARIINRGRKAEDLRRQTADGGQNLIGRDHAVVLCGDQPPTPVVNTGSLYS